MGYKNGIVSGLNVYAFVSDNQNGSITEYIYDFYESKDDKSAPKPVRFDMTQERDNYVITGASIRAVKELSGIETSIPVFDNFDYLYDYVNGDKEAIYYAINYVGAMEIPDNVQLEIDSNLAKQQEIKDRLAQDNYEVTGAELEDMVSEILSIVKTRAEEEQEANIEDIVRTAVAEAVAVAEPEPEPDTQDWTGLFG